jgi:hypothetical protein
MHEEYETERAPKKIIWNRFNPHTGKLILYDYEDNVSYYNYKNVSYYYRIEKKNWYKITGSILKVQHIETC